MFQGLRREQTPTGPNPAAAVLQMLDRIPSLCDQLIYLAGTWNPAAKMYEEPILAAKFRREDIHAALRRQHRRVFSEWLAMSLSEQSAELIQYFDMAGLHRLGTVRLWMNGWCERLIPPETNPAERMLFSSDMDVVLHMIDAEMTGSVYL
jgi:hypothetical protein